MLTAVIHRGQGLNLYCPSVKHKSKYVNQQSKRNDHKQASERERGVEEGGIGKQSTNGKSYYEERKGLWEGEI